MKNVLKTIGNALNSIDKFMVEELNIKGGRWDSLFDRTHNYVVDFFTNTKIWAMPIKIAYDLWDLITYNGFAFIGGFLCACIIL